MKPYDKVRRKDGKPFGHGGLEATLVRIEFSNIAPTRAYLEETSEVTWATDITSVTPEALSSPEELLKELYKLGATRKKTLRRIAVLDAAIALELNNNPDTVFRRMRRARTLAETNRKLCKCMKALIPLLEC